MAVVVLEGREVGAATTGNSSGKLSLLQGTRLSRIASKHPSSLVDAYVSANREAMVWLLGYCAANSVPVQREDAYTYAHGPDGVRSANAELRACQAAGLEVSWQDELDVPFPSCGGVRLTNQAQFDPMDVLDALLGELVERGGIVVEHTRVTAVHKKCGATEVVTDGGAVTADRAVLATGTPILDRGGYFARLEPLRSYCAAFAVPGPIPQSMYLSADTSRSVRYAPTAEGDRLVVGGYGHTVGRHQTPNRAVDRLVAWTQRHFPGASMTHSWSAQDYESIDALPYAGPLLPGDDRILMATGFDKWGMTNAVASALLLSQRITGGTVSWATAFDSWNARQIAGLPTAARINTAVGINLVRGWIEPQLHGADADTLQDGQGRVGRGFPVPIARCNDQGRTHTLSAVCPHLGGIVRWNDAERSWDCPLHGSRFSADGSVEEGPATTGLHELDG
jgi:glycine/D-amino acid oxidase-like deaminating enzyme/nitrite reductase/ring-hydroxylating ferredoxin subunit